MWACARIRDRLCVAVYTCIWPLVWLFRQMLSSDTMWLTVLWWSFMWRWEMENHLLSCPSPNMGKRSNDEQICHLKSMSNPVIIEHCQTIVVISVFSFFFFWISQAFFKKYNFLCSPLANFSALNKQVNILVLFFLHAFCHLSSL